MENAKQFYELDEGSRREAERALLREVTKHAFRRLCDIGCGNGHFLRYFSEDESEGIELSAEMIAESGDLQSRIFQANIANCPDLVENRKEIYDVVTSNYVFTELKEKELRSSFANIYQILSKKGRFIFTITDPRTRGQIIFPDYKLVFDEPYEYNKKDLRFKVLLKNGVDYKDVGIVDYHRPIEDYDLMLKEAGFRNIKREDLTYQEGGNKEISYAVVYSARKS